MSLRGMRLLVAMVFATALGTQGCDTFVQGAQDVSGVWYFDRINTGNGWESPEDQAEPGVPMTTYFLLIMREDGTFELRVGILNVNEWLTSTGTWREDGSAYVLTDDQEPPSTVRMWFKNGWLFASEGAVSYRLTRQATYWPTRDG